MDQKKTLKITGMSCASCAARIEKVLNKQEGVKRATVNFTLEQATIEYDDQLVREQQLHEIIRRLGFNVIGASPPGGWSSISKG